MKDNKLLAEYLDNPKLATSILWCPHKDWNQLMMIVEKIEEEPYIYVGIEHKRCIVVYFDEYGKRHTKLNAVENTKINAVYNACVAYVKSITK